MNTDKDKQKSGSKTDSSGDKIHIQITLNDSNSSSGGKNKMGETAWPGRLLQGLEATLKFRRAISLGFCIGGATTRGYLTRLYPNPPARQKSALPSRSPLPPPLQPLS